MSRQRSERYEQAAVDLMLRAYSEATGAAMASIARYCIKESIERALRENQGIRERYNVARTRLLSEARVVPLHAVK